MKNILAKAVLCLPLGLAAFTGTTPVHAFKIKSHVITANQVIKALEVGEFSGIEAGTIRPAVQEAVTNWPEYFRAGTLGPDAFPDFFAGQIYVHVNNGQDEDVAEGADESRADVPFEARRLNPGPDGVGWRSADYGMYMFRRAWQYHLERSGAGVDQATKDEGLQALAFAYGYFGHMIGDGFAHSLVNEWAGGAWEYFDGQGSMFPLGEEIKHFAVEGLIDDFIVRQDDEVDLRIQAPYKFLYEIFTEEVALQVGTDNIVFGPKGSFAGAHYQALVDFRDQLRELSDSDNWTGSELGSWAIDVTDQVHHILSAGTDIGNPVADVEHFFETRAELFDVVLEEWIWLSHCIGQNMIWTANLEYGGSARRAYDPRGNLENDACEEINFEPDGSGLGSLYRGNLNIAAHGFYDDPGSIENNLDRMGEFLTVAITEILSFDPLRDIGSLNTVAELVPLCEPVVEWDSCDNACTTARDLCTEVVEAAACFGCPKEDGEYHCSGLAGAAVCFPLSPAFLPHCPACAGLQVVFEEVIEDGCAAAVSSGSFHVCDFCSKTPVCEVWETTQLVETMLKGELEDVMARLTAPLRDAVINAVLLGTFGPHYEQARDAMNLFRMRRHRGGGVWFVNIVYFYEDLKAGGLPYLYELMAKGMGVPIAALTPALTAEELALATWPFVPPGVLTYSEYLAMLEEFWGISHGDTPSPFVGRSATDWLVAAGVPHPGGALMTKFAAILDALGMLVDRPGPTAEALLELTSGHDIDPNNIDDVATDIDNFTPLRNASAVLWMSLFEEWTANMQVTGSSSPEFQYSSVCAPTADGLMPSHIMCDGIASLDDPNRLGVRAYSYEGEGFVSYGSALADFDPARAVYAWDSRPIVWKRGFVGPEAECRLGRTGFTLARTDEDLDELYLPNIWGPENCDIAPGFVGFEDPDAPWTPISSGVDPIIDCGMSSEGSCSLRPQGCGNQTLESPWHRTVDWHMVGREILLDVYVPSSPSTTYWAGDIQLFLTVPGVVNNAWSTGTALLTPLPRDTWSTVSFILPEDAYQALLGDHPDARFSLQMNWPDCGNQMAIDNLRWGSDAEARTVFHSRGSSDLPVATGSVLTFDDASKWSGPVFTEGVESPKVEGEGALKVSASNWTPITSAPFLSDELEGLVSDRMSIDVYLPDPDASLYWTGDLQLFLNCPTANVYDLQMGATLPLTNQFDGEYNTFYFDLEPAGLAALISSGNECTFKVVLNVTPGGEFYLDNLGFVHE